MSSKDNDENKSNVETSGKTIFTLDDFQMKDDDEDEDNEYDNEDDDPFGVFI